MDPQGITNGVGQQKSNYISKDNRLFQNRFKRRGGEIENMYGKKISAMN